MSYDGFVTHSVVHELNGKILGGKLIKYTSLKAMK